MDNKKNFQAFKKTCLSESVALSAISHNVGPSPAVCAVQVCFFAAIPVPIPIYIYIRPGRLVRRRRESKFSSGQPRYFSLIVTFGRGDSHCSCNVAFPPWKHSDNVAFPPWKHSDDVAFPPWKHSDNVAFPPWKHSNNVTFPPWKHSDNVAFPPWKHSDNVAIPPRRQCNNVAFNFHPENVEVST